MQYNVGDVIEGKVTGIQPYGAFIAFDGGMLGLLHISEISDGFVKDVGEFVKIEELISVKVIDVDEQNNQYKLSLKALKKPSLRKNKQRRGPSRLPNSKIGFTSIENKLNEWIKEAAND